MSPATPTPTPPDERLPLAADAALPRPLPVIEERAVIRREVVETGRVRLRREVTETAETLHVPLQHEQVQVERVPLNQLLPAGAEAPAPRQEGDVLIVPVVREVAVVETRLLLVEEVRVVKQRLTTEHTETVPLRREEIHVERLPGAS